MPTNRKRKRRNSQLEPWKMTYLQLGHVPREDGTNSPKPFLWAEDYHGCFADNWLPMWQ